MRQTSEELENAYNKQADMQDLVEVKRRYILTIFRLILLLFFIIIH